MPYGTHGELTRRLQWRCYGSYNCPICASMRGKVYTYDQWHAAAIWPGFHLNCDCDLKEVGNDVPLSDPAFFGMDLDLMENVFAWDHNYLFWMIIFSRTWQPYNQRFPQMILEGFDKYGAGATYKKIIKSYLDEQKYFFGPSDQSHTAIQWGRYFHMAKMESHDGTFFGFLLNTFKAWYKNPYGHHAYHSLFLKPDQLLPFQPIDDAYTEVWEY